MPRATLRDHVIHYQQAGRGPDIVLIHGLFCNIAFWWFRVAPKLAETHRVTALDLRGHGFSAMSSAGYRAVDMAADVAALMDHLGIRQAHVIGHSFGGAVALALAARDPAKVQRVTLADAWVPSIQTSAPLADEAGWHRVQARLSARGIHLQGDLPRVAQGFFEELLDSAEAEGSAAGGALAGPAMGPMGGQMGQPSRALRRWRDLMERTSAHRELHDPAGLGDAHLRRVEQPVDLIYGARSRYLANRDGLKALLPRRRVVMVPEAGHFFPLLRPEAFLQALNPPDPAPMSRADVA